MYHLAVLLPKLSASQVRTNQCMARPHAYRHLRGTTCHPAAHRLRLPPPWDTTYHLMARAVRQHVQQVRIRTRPDRPRVSTPTRGTTSPPMPLARRFLVLPAPTSHPQEQPPASMPLPATSFTTTTLPARPPALPAPTSPAPVSQRA